MINKNDMDILNFSQFEWAYTFCKNLQFKLKNKLQPDLNIRLAIHNVDHKLITSIIIHNKSKIKNDKKNRKFKIIIDIVPEGMSWTQMHQRWQQIHQNQGLNEYYVYAPHSNDFFAWQRFEQQLIPLPKQTRYASAFLRIRFEHYTDTLEVFTTEHQPFLNFKEQTIAFEETQQTLRTYQTALREKQLLLEQAYQRLDMFEKYYQNRQQHQRKYKMSS